MKICRRCDKPIIGPADEVSPLRPTGAAPTVYTHPGGRCPKAPQQTTPKQHHP
ncbi:hypothetical protein ACQEV4_42830 [Streptomyces shenzhenensis]|uniref:hypothetical protein n=1 Tax=Streptomyces shenzhenensis TaxID=943815 RepID=UPI003D94FF50